MRLLDEAVDRAQPEAGAAAGFLGREERLEGALAGLRRHAAAGVADRDRDEAVRRGLDLGEARPPAGTAQTSARKRSSPPAGIASRALIAMFSSADSSCPGSAMTRVSAAPTVDLDADPLVERAPQHVGERMQHRAGIDGERLQHLPAREREELARQLGAAPRCAARGGEQLAAVAVARPGSAGRRAPAGCPG